MQEQEQEHESGGRIQSIKRSNGGRGKRQDLVARAKVNYCVMRSHVLEGEELIVTSSKLEGTDFGSLILAEVEDVQTFAVIIYVLHMVSCQPPALVILLRLVGVQYQSIVYNGTNEVLISLRF